MGVAGLTGWDGFNSGAASLARNYALLEATLTLRAEGRTYVASYDSAGWSFEEVTFWWKGEA